MKTNRIIVALNMTILSVLEKIAKTRRVRTNFQSNPQAFANPDPSLAAITQAADELEAAYISAADGGVAKTAAMHAKEVALMTLMEKVRQYVENVANAAADPTLVLLAGLDVKKTPGRPSQGFTIRQDKDSSGEVKLTCVPKDHCLYKWQYCKEPMSANPWTDAGTTTVSKTTVNGLSPGFYWFRVLITDVEGTHEEEPVSFVVK